jgi:hypothetical protein
VQNKPVRAGALLFSDGGQFLPAAKGSISRRRFHRAALVYFDNLSNMYAPGLDANKPTDARHVMSALADIAHKTGATMIGVRHWRKLQGDARSRGMGAVEIANVARASITIGKHPEISGRRICAPNKANYAPDGGASREFDIASTAVFGRDGTVIKDDDGHDFMVGRVVWGEASEVSADDLSMSEAPGTKSRGKEARAWLAARLADGLVARATVLEEAKAAGFSESMMQRTAKRVAISEPSGFPATTCWRLPKGGSPVTLALE